MCLQGDTVTDDVVSSRWMTKFFQILMTAQFLHLGKAISFLSGAGPIPRLPSFAQKWRSWWCTRRGPQMWRWPFFRSKKLGLKQSAITETMKIFVESLEGVFVWEIMKSTSFNDIETSDICFEHTHRHVKQTMWWWLPATTSINLKHSSNMKESNVYWTYIHAGIQGVLVVMYFQYSAYYALSDI